MVCKYILGVLGALFADCKSNIVAILSWYIFTPFIPKILSKTLSKRHEMSAESIQKRRGIYQLFIKNDITILLLYVQ